jgi:aspartate dehydrogenase
VTDPLPSRVGLIGHGAIGSVVACRLVARDVPSAKLVGVHARRRLVDPPAPQVDADELLAMSDVIVEAAGHQAVRDHAVPTLEAGLDLVLVSLGALGDMDLEATIRAAGPGRLTICTGAVGGIDLLRSAHRMAELDCVQITTTKRPEALVQPWMDETLLAKLETEVVATTVFDGSARDAAARFPKSVNVAATLALALDDWDLVRVRIVADPGTPYTRHVIHAAGAAGSYRFDISNVPSEHNPATSAVVPYAALQAVADLCAGPMALWRKQDF